jgi:hypothetical protein
MPGVGVEVSLMADRLTRTGHERSLSRRGRLVASGIVGLVACLGALAYAAQTLAAAASAGSPPTSLTVDYAAHPLAIESALLRRGFAAGAPARVSDQGQDVAQLHVSSADRGELDRDCRLHER